MTDGGPHLADYMRLLVGLPCWSVIGGEKDDLTLVVDLGAQRPRSLRLANRALSFQQRTFEGEAGLWIQCPWRIESEDTVLASSYDSAGMDETLRQTVSALEGARVEAVSADGPGWDLSVQFDSGRTLRAFCLEVQEGRSAGNWFAWTPDGTVDVGPRSRLTMRSAKTDDLPPLERFAVVDPLDDEAEIKLWQARWRAHREKGPVNDD